MNYFYSKKQPTIVVSVSCDGKKTAHPLSNLSRSLGAWEGKNEWLDEIEPHFVKIYKMCGLK